VAHLIQIVPALIEMPSWEGFVRMIRRCADRDFEAIWAIINDGAPGRHRAACRSNRL
jgi:hypothetical protein